MDLARQITPDRRAKRLQEDKHSHIAPEWLNRNAETDEITCIQVWVHAIHQNPVQIILKPLQFVFYD